jgi:DNA primase
MDQATTALLAAAIESIDRVGPYNCRVQLQSIEDIREKRRKQIVDRAKHILQRWSADTRSGSAEALKEITNSAKVQEIVTYGPDSVPAGPEAAISSELIVVEGRADITVLLRAGYRNCVAVNGVTVPKSVVDLTLKKERVIALVDGDRVGDMILRELARVGKVDFVSKAPSGREVEELSPSEVIDLLGKKIPLADYLARLNQKPQEGPLEAPEPRVEFKPVEVKEQQARPHAEERNRMIVTAAERNRMIVTAAERNRMIVTAAERNRMIMSAETRGVLRPSAEGVQGKLTSVILGENGEVLAEVPIIQLVDKLKEMNNVSYIILDGIITQRLIDMASSKSARVVVGERVGELEKRPSGMTIITLKEVLS